MFINVKSFLFHFKKKKNEGQQFKKTLMNQMDFMESIWMTITCLTIYKKMIKR